MENYTVALILLSIIFTIILHLFKQSQKSSKSKQLPPGPKPWPIIGNLHLLGDKPHRTVAQLAKIHGPLMSLKLGNTTTIVISSPKIAKEMFENHDLNFAGRKVPDAAGAGDHNQFSMVWLPICSKWRLLRKISAVQLFTNQRLDASHGLRRKKVDELLDYARNCCGKGVAIDIGKAGFTTSLNLLSNTFFSIDLTSYGSSISREFKELFAIMLEEGGNPNVSDFFPLVKYLDLQGIRRRITGHFDKMMRVFEEI